MASTAENILARVKRDLAEINAKLVSWENITVAKCSTDADKTAARKGIRMTRKWPKIDDRIRDAYEDYLREYGSVINGDTQNMFVVNPMADQEVRSGTWRVLRVYSSAEKTIPEEQGIYQVLVQLDPIITTYKSVDRFKSVQYVVNIDRMECEPTIDFIEDTVAAKYPELTTTYDGCVSSTELRGVTFIESEGVWKGTGVINVLDPSLANFESTKAYKQIRIGVSGQFKSNTIGTSSRSSNSQSRSNSSGNSQSSSTSNSQ